MACCNSRRSLESVSVVMRCLSFQLVRSAGILIFAVMIPGPVESSIDRRSAAPEDASARLNREVRLRKLHLVRPDLIPYPISYEIHC